MKTGKTLPELAQELQRQAKAKKDFIADTRHLEVTPNSNLIINNGSPNKFSITQHTHSQIAQRLNIPQKYYTRMRNEAPELLANNINTWFKIKPERRMVRTLDQHARAFLSDRYRRIDNYKLAEHALQILSEVTGTIELASAEVTEKWMHIKVLNPRLKREVKKGDIVQAGISIANSEVGAGSLRVEPLVFRLVCTNGMIAADHSIRKYHVGQRAAEKEDAYELYSDETLKADDEAFFLKIRDTIKAVVDSTRFQTIVERLQTATEQKINGSPAQAVEVLSKEFSFSGEEKDGILTNLIQDKDLSAYGLINAITRTSQTVKDYDRATQLERESSKILQLEPATWNRIANASLN